MHTDLTFVDPYTKESLSTDEHGNLYRLTKNGRIVYQHRGGCYDFVTASPEMQKEKEHYDKEYQAKIRRRKPLSFSLIHDLWFDETTPWYRSLLYSLGDLSGKDVLLVGNGGSPRELYFAFLGANLVFSDLSIEAVCGMKELLLQSELSHFAMGKVEFHSLDATHLPFEDAAFDIIYGAAFVHHLDDIDQFLSEVRRCLKPGGICRFLDQADSPLWNTLKRSILRPMQLYSYWRHPRSPEDLRSNFRNVFNQKTLMRKMREHDFGELIFECSWFLLPIAYRHYGKAVDWNLTAMQKAKRALLFTRQMDSWLCERSWMKKHRLILVWGFNR